MAIELEGLEFQISGNSKEAVKNIDNLIATLSRLKETVKGGVGLTSVAKQTEKLNETAANANNLGALRDLITTIGNLSKLNEVKISSRIPNRIRDICASAESITPDVISNIRSLSSALEDLGNRDVSNLRIPNISNATNVTSNIVTSATSPLFSSDTFQGADEIAQVTGRILDMSTAGVKLSKVFTAVGIAGRTAGKAFMAFNSLSVKSITRLGSKVKELTGRFTSLFSSLKRIAMYRAIRAAISAITKGFSEGISNLYQWSLLVDRRFANSMDKIATSTLYLKNSLGAMVAPLINALAPAIDMVVDKFVVLLNTINQTIAKLTGADTYTAAKKVATEWAKAEESVKKSIEGIKRYVLAFDELNILGKPDSGKSTNKEKDVLDYASMFENLPVESAIGSFVNRLKQAFLSENWRELGTIIGNKINSMFDSIPWGDIGTKIGSKINGAIQTVYYTLDTVNFTNIGSKIATLFNNALGEIDFSYVGAMIVKPFTAVADTLIGVFTTMDWGLVTRSLSDGLKGVYDEFTKWLNSVDWHNFGEKLYKAIKDILTNIDYIGLARSFFTFMWTALKSVLSIIGGIFSGIGEDLEPVWDNVKKGTIEIINKLKSLGSSAVSKIKEGILSGITNIGQWVYDHVLKPIFGEIDENDIKVPIQLAKRGWSTVTEWIKKATNWGAETVVKSIGIQKQGWTTIAEWIKTANNWGAETLYKSISTQKKGWTTISEWITSAGNWGAEVLYRTISLNKQGWDTVSKWLTDPVRWGTDLIKRISLAHSDWKTVTDWIKAAGNWGAEIVDKKIALLKYNWTNVVSWIKMAGNWGTDIVEKKISLTKEGWTTVFNWITKATNWGTDLIEKKISLFKQGWSNVATWIKSSGNWGEDVVDKTIGLKQASYWTDVAKWINQSWLGGVVDKTIGLKQASYWTDVAGWITSSWLGSAVDKIIGLKQASYWTDVANWITKSWLGGVVDKAIGLKQASYWSTVSGWITKSWLGGVVDKTIGLTQAKYWTNVTKWIEDNWLGNGVVEIGVSLFKSGWSSLRQFFGLSTGGYYTGHGFEMFKSGGVITDNGYKQFWDNIPKYGRGTNNAHGSMFVAGEAGAELVGHVNGRTEVLNKSQLGQIMHRSIVDGMNQFVTDINIINRQMVSCTNGVISAILTSADMVSRNMQYTNPATDNYDNLIDLMAKTQYEQRSEESKESIREGVREGVNDVMSIQNGYLRDIIAELRSKQRNDVVISSNQIVHALQNKNQLDGITTVPIYN